MEEEIIKSSYKTPNKVGVIQHTEISDENDDCQPAQEDAEKLSNPSTSGSTHQDNDPNRHDQENEIRTTPVRMCVEEVESTEYTFTSPDKKKKRDPEMPEKLINTFNTQETHVTTSQSSYDFSQSDNMANEQKPTNEPLVESRGELQMNRTEYNTNELKQVRSEIHQVSIEQAVNMIIQSPQIENGSGENMQLIQQSPLESKVTESSDGTPTKLKPNGITQSTADYVASIPEPNSVELAYPKPLLATLKRKRTDSSEEIVECESSTKDTLIISDSENADHEDLKLSDSHVNNSIRKYHDQVSSSSTGEHDMVHELKQTIQHNDHAYSTELPQETISTTPFSDNPPKSNGTGASDQEPDFKTPLITHVSTLQRPRGVGTQVASSSTPHRVYLIEPGGSWINPKHESERWYSTTYQVNSQSPQTPFQQLSTITLTDAEKDQDGYLPNDKKTLQYNSSSELTHECSYHSEAAGIMLSSLLKKRSQDNDVLTTEELNKAILQGKPEPPMHKESNQTAKSKETKEMYNHENNSLAQNIYWITGSHYLKNYLCWPCLLFGYASWKLPITLGYSSILEAAKMHENTIPHMSASLKFLVYETTLKQEKQAQLEKDLESKRKTLLLLKLLIGITSFNANSTAAEHVELLSLACSYNTELQEFIKGKSDNFLEDFVASMLIHITGAIEYLLQATISEEIKNSSFVSIIFEDTTDVVDKSSLLAVILRYVTDSGILRERFVKLIKLGTSRSVADFLKNMNLLVQEYQLTDKLVGFTYSGTVIPPKEILIFNKTVNRLNSKAVFFPYQEHNLKKIITQTLSHIPECRILFHTMSELAEFFNNTPNVKNVLLQIGMKEGTNQWNFENDIISTIKYHYETIMHFLHQCIEQGINDESVTVEQIQYFTRFLNSADCQNLVSIISAILNAIDNLCTEMETDLNTDNWNTLLVRATKTLTKMKKIGLQRFLQKSRQKDNAMKSGGPGVQSSITSDIYDQIIDATLLAMNHRILDTDLAFVGPRYIEALSKCDKKHLDSRLQRINVHPRDFSVLKKKVKSFLGNPSNQNLEAAVKQMQEAKVKDSDDRVLLKFLQLCITIPTKERNSSNSSPAVYRLRSYIAKKKPLKYLDLLVFMENDIWSSIKEEKLYDYVIKRCAQDN